MVTASREMVGLERMSDYTSILIREASLLCTYQRKLEVFQCLEIWVCSSDSALFRCQEDRASEHGHSSSLAAKQQEIDHVM